MNKMIPIERIASKIYLIRNVKVMLDRDLAELYAVETKVLKQAVRRNSNRFPADFMFELTRDEFKNLRSQIVTSNQDLMGLRIKPFAFTEHGVLMLSSVLKSKRNSKIVDATFKDGIHRIFNSLKNFSFPCSSVEMHTI